MPAQKLELFPFKLLNGHNNGIYHISYEDSRNRENDYSNHKAAEHFDESLINNISHVDDPLKNIIVL